MSSIPEPIREARGGGDAEPTAPAGSLLIAADADRCHVCSATLAVDQRYCVECGTRRGNPRFVLATATDGEPESAGRDRLGMRAGVAAVNRFQLLLTLLVVLVAVGVGVLIGAAGAGPTRVTLVGTRVAAATGTATSSAKPAKPGAGSSTGTTTNFFSNGGN